MDSRVLAAALLVALSSAPLAVSATAPLLDLVAILTVAVPMDVGPPFSCGFCLWSHSIPLATFGEEGSAPEPLPPSEYRFEAAVADGACVQGATSVLRLTPAAGVWGPVFVQRTYPALSLQYVEDHTGSAEPILIADQCSSNGWHGMDVLILPQGTWAQAIEASLELPLRGGGTAADADVFPALG